MNTLECIPRWEVLVMICSMVLSIGTIGQSIVRSIKRMRAAR